MAAVSDARQAILARVERARTRVGDLRRARSDLAVALRMIGPPKPWGAPAAALAKIEGAAQALSRLGDELDVEGARVRKRGQAMGEALAGAEREVATLLQTPLSGLFARIAASLEAEAARSGREVEVVVLGGELEVDRGVVEQLTDELEAQAEGVFAYLDELGSGSLLEGVIAGIEANWFQGEIADAAYRLQRQVSSGRSVVVEPSGKNV
jgi:hypothetical protein